MRVNALPVGIVDVMNVANQEVAIDVRGAGVLTISGNVAEPDNPDEITTDWMALIVAAMNLGMMGGEARPPWSSRAILTKRIFDPETVRMQWTLAMEQVDPGAFLVILSVLSARRLDEVSLRTVAAPPDARQLDVSALAYPPPYRDVPFEICRETPLRTTRDRMVRIEFAQAPGDDLQDLVASAVDVWGQILILGGYAPMERHPRLTHTMPDFAYWLDDVTFVQPFEESFESDASCFSAIIGFAARVHHEGTAVRAVTIV